ncbi:Phage lysis regulatory protein, LysB family [Azotobacter chroococcum NCIMB 8003]|uniref:Phage lysis regulatory protein, LysB family n=3 Tax=Azotobacter chroococcum TaxID=353 RepID=A0A0C4WMZ1_9GAMM|nr:Phage lysis regulatory protein, LysB family [Azotobacter chroococcum NCIMB 8003]
MKMEQIRKFGPRDGSAAGEGPGMTRSSLLVAALMVLLLWLLSRETDALRIELGRVSERADQAERLASQRQADIERLTALLGSERGSRERLRHEQDDLRAALVGHQQRLEELKHENQKLRDWAAESLPAARRLRDQPAITDVDAYREHLSGSDARPAAAVEQSAQ